MDIFMQASRVNLKFQTSKGLVTDHDLWSLGITKLREMGKEILLRLKDTKTGDPLFDETPVTESKEVTLDRLRLDIIRAIVQTKTEEEKATKAAAVAKAEIQREVDLLVAARDQKRVEQINNLTPEQIEDRLRELAGKI